MALTKVKLVADGVIDVDHLAANHGITTTNIGEGTALYYTDARVQSYLTTNSYATESYVSTNYLPLVGGTLTGSLTTASPLTIQAASPYIQWKNASSTRLGYIQHNETDLVMSVDTGNIILDGGDVGIGTNPARAKLEVNGENYDVTNSGRSVGGIHISSTNNNGQDTYSGGISFAGPGSGSAAISAVQGTSDGDTQGLAFFTHPSGTGANNSVEYMRLTYNGNLGIGTPGPGDKLDVLGNVRISGVGNALYFDTTGADASNGIKTINDYESVIFNDRGASGFAVIGNNSIRLGFGSSYTAAQSSIYIPSTNGNVGIKSTSPESEISSNATVLQIDDSNVASLALNNSSSGKYEVAATGLGLDIRRNGSNYITVDTSGRVGVGITSPSSYDSNANNLVIGSTGANDKNGITIVGGDTDGRGAIYFADTTQNSAGYITYFHSNNSMLFGTSDSTAMTIDSSGRVGVGRTTPDNLLTVRGTNALIDVQSSADSQTIGLLARYQNNATLGGRFIYTTGDAQLYIDNLWVGNNDVYSDITFRNCTTGGALTERLRIKGSTGTVLIGAPSSIAPNAKLQIGDAVSPSSAAALQVNGFVRMRNALLIHSESDLSTAGYITYNSSGYSFMSEGAGASKNVGIGTTTPAGLLNTYVSDNRQITHYGNNGDLSVISDNNSQTVFYIKGNGNAPMMSVHDTNKTAFQILGNRNMRIHHGYGDIYQHLGSVGTATGNYYHIRLRTPWNDTSMTMFRITGYYPYSEYAESYMGAYRYPNSTYRYTPFGQINHNQGTWAAAHSQYNTNADPGYLVLVIYWPTSYTGVTVEHIGAGDSYGSFMNSDLEIIDYVKTNDTTAQW